MSVREAVVMDCETARLTLDAYFQSEATPERERSLNDVLYNHLTDHARGGSTASHHISCQPCWDYYHQLKQRYCGG